MYKHKLGAVIHTPNDDQVKASLALGFERFRLTPEWPTIMNKDQSFNFGWLDHLISGVLKDSYESGHLLFSIFAIPAWLDPTQPKNPYGTIGYFTPDWTPIWLKVVSALVDRYPKVKEWGIITETDVKATWNGTAQQWLDWIARPAAEVIHAAGGKVVGPGVTTLNANYLYDPDPANQKKNPALRDLLYLWQNGADVFDIFDLHSYCSNGHASWKNMKRLFDLLGLWDTDKPICMSEVGFSYTFKWDTSGNLFQQVLDNGSFFLMSGEDRQYTRYMDFLSDIDQYLPRLHSMYLFHAFDGWQVSSTPPQGDIVDDAYFQYKMAGGMGLMDSNLQIKKAGKLVQQLLEKGTTDPIPDPPPPDPKPKPVPKSVYHYRVSFSGDFELELDHAVKNPALIAKKLEQSLPQVLDASFLNMTGTVTEVTKQSGLAPIDVTNADIKYVTLTSMPSKS